MGAVTRRWVLALLLAVAVAPAGAQDLAFDTGQLDIVTARGTRHAFTVELAVTDRQLAQGLMFRKSMPADAGMLFDFGEARPISMWMKNTLIALDMLFLDAGGRVVGVAPDAVPLSTTVISSPGPVRAVLELNSGTAARLGLRAGDRVVHPVFSASR